MPNFTNPFPGGKPDRYLTETELIRTLRLDLCAEQDAVALYTAHAEACNDPVVSDALLDIANEEKVHVGELLSLIEHLDPDEATLLRKGKTEVQNKFPELRYSPGSGVKPTVVGRR